jgi:hypothetical protein
MRNRLSPASVLALIALFVALTGTATAASTVFITGAQIKDGTIGVKDLSKKARHTLRGPRGRQGETGIDGIPGPVGPVGPAGGFNQSKIQYVTGPPRMFASGERAYVHAECPSGSKILSGGYWGAGMLVHSESSQDLRSWSVLIENDYINPVQAQAWAVCAAA